MNASLVIVAAVVDLFSWVRGIDPHTSTMMGSLVIVCGYAVSAIETDVRRWLIAGVALLGALMALWLPVLTNPLCGAIIAFIPAWFILTGRPRRRAIT
jgi:hypothetical protein